jgi:hypothetical protein
MPPGLTRKVVMRVNGQPRNGFYLDCRRPRADAQGCQGGLAAAPCRPAWAQRQPGGPRASERCLLSFGTLRPVMLPGLYNTYQFVQTTIRSPSTSRWSTTRIVHECDQHLPASVRP